MTKRTENVINVIKTIVCLGAVALTVFGLTQCGSARTPAEAETTVSDSLVFTGDLADCKAYSVQSSHHDNIGALVIRCPNSSTTTKIGKTTTTVVSN